MSSAELQRPAPEAEVAPAPVVAAERRGATGPWRAWFRRWGRVPLDLGPALFAVLGTWLASRVAVLVVSLLGARSVDNPRASRVPDVVELWDRWDVGLFVKVARYGYLSPAYADRTEVDLPGMPIAMRLVHPFVGNWVVAGIVVSLLAGLVASAALYRLAVDDARLERGVGLPTREPVDPGDLDLDLDLDRDLDRGRRAVLFLVCFPYAVFLFAGYSEGLFAAFATVAWVAVRRERWALAAVCTAGATGTRVLGIALLAAVWVEYLVSVRRSRLRTGTWAWRSRPLQVAWLLLPLAPLIAFCAYFQVRTGHWDAYTRAMREHWGRVVAWPWKGLETTWRQAMSVDQGAAFRVFWWAELLAVVVGLVLAGVLLSSRRWGEATYVGGSTAIMACSSYWASGVRAVLVWFPLYLVLARRPGLLAPYLWLCAPLAAVFVVAFTSGIWVD